MRFVRRGPVCHLLAFPFFQCLSFFNFSAALCCGQTSRCCAKLLTINFFGILEAVCKTLWCVCLCMSVLELSSQEQKLVSGIVGVVDSISTATKALCLETCNPILIHPFCGIFSKGYIQHLGTGGGWISLHSAFLVQLLCISGKE